MGGERSRVKTCSKGPQAEIKPCRCGEASTRGAFQEQVETCGEYAERECVDLSLVSLLVCTVCFTDEVNKQHPLWRIHLPSNHSSVRCGLWKLHMCVFVFFFKLKREFSAGVTERMDAGVSCTHTVKLDEQFFSQPWQSKGWILFLLCVFPVYLHAQRALPPSGHSIP